MSTVRYCDFRLRKSILIFDFLFFVDFRIAGSDVAGMTTTATKTPCGQFYEVTGSKKW